MRNGRNWVVPKRRLRLPNRPIWYNICYLTNRPILPICPIDQFGTHLLFDQFGATLSHFLYLLHLPLLFSLPFCILEPPGPRRGLDRTSSNEPQWTWNSCLSMSFCQSFQEWFRPFSKSMCISVTTLHCIQVFLCIRWLTVVIYKC